MAAGRVPGWRRCLFLLFAVLAVGWAIVIFDALVNLIVLRSGDPGELLIPVAMVLVSCFCCFLAWEQGPHPAEPSAPAEPYAPEPSFDWRPPVASSPMRPTRWAIVVPVGVVVAVLVIGSAFVLETVTGWGVSAAAPVARQGGQISRFTPALQEPWRAQVGPTPVFTANGQGSSTTIPFVLGGGALSGLMTASGPTDFRLVAVYPDGSTPGTALVGCRARCSGQQWAGPPTAGFYQLKVSSEPGTLWRLDLRETHSHAMEFAAAADPRGTRLAAGGTSGDQSPAFQLAGQPWSAGMLRLQGSFHATTHAIFYLVPEGSRLDPQRDLVVNSPDGGDGGWGNVLRLPGRYVLVASTMGGWSFTMGPP